MNQPEQHYVSKGEKEKTKAINSTYTKVKLLLTDETEKKKNYANRGEANKVIRCCDKRIGTFAVRASTLLLTTSRPSFISLNTDASCGASLRDPSKITKRDQSKNGKHIISKHTITFYFWFCMSTMV